MRYHGPCPSDSKPQKNGVLLLNLGSPDSPEVADVRRYLAEFLSDPRIVERPKMLWWPILHGIILRTRPKRSAAAFRKIWTEDGSPLIAISRRQQAALQQELDRRAPGQFRVELAMRYGNPSIADGLERLRQANAKRITVLPLYPQYSATTTGSTFDAVTATLRQWRWIPELHFNDHYHTHPDYIDALATSVRRYWQQHGEPEKLLISFHGIPQEYADAGDPYPQECNTTAQLLTTELGIDPDRWQLSFQSRLGPQKWLHPYTDQTLQQLGSNGLKSLHVICPGFASDCLETLEEIALENRAVFQQAGGGNYHYIPALNDDAAHIKLLTNLLALNIEH
jgi:ferrochelatase